MEFTDNKMKPIKHLHPAQILPSTGTFYIPRMLYEIPNSALKEKFVV